jgi:hypothetical protein
MNEATTRACEMLEGYIRAASLRYDIYMGVTGGHDSRVLFLSSLNVPCKYYVTRHSYMHNGHHDIAISRKLAEILSKEFRIVTEEPIDDTLHRAQDLSIDFPREYDQPDTAYKDHMLINGNVSEIARNCLGNQSRVNARELTTLYRYRGSNYFRLQCKSWLQENKETILRNGYNLLDMFYWEERMGNWAAKAKTETSNLGTIMYSPFSSHRLLTTLLSTDRKERDKRVNRLYHSIMHRFSPEAAKLPINPSRKMSLILIAKRLKAFDIIHTTGVRLSNLLYLNPKP